MDIDNSGVCSGMNTRDQNVKYINGNEMSGEMSKMNALHADFSHIDALHTGLVETVVLPAPYSVRRSSAADIAIVGDLVCAEEVLEVWHLHRMSVVDTLRKTLELAYYGHGEVYTLYDGEEIIGMGGLFPLQHMGRIGAEIWFIGMNLSGHNRLCLEHIKPVIQYFINKYPILMNVVGVWNRQSIRWLRYVGFHVEERGICTGKNNAYFHQFYLTKAAWENRRNNVCR